MISSATCLSILMRTLSGPAAVGFVSLMAKQSSSSDIDLLGGWCRSKSRAMLCVS